MGGAPRAAARTVAEEEAIDAATVWFDDLRV
jgi:hypothetical protein